MSGFEGFRDWQHCFAEPGGSTVIQVSCKGPDNAMAACHQNVRDEVRGSQTFPGCLKPTPSHAPILAVVAASQRRSIRRRKAALLSSRAQIAALMQRFSSAARARSRLKDMRRHLAHGTGSKAASSYLRDLTTALLSQQAVADMQHRTVSLRYGTCQKTVASFCLWWAVSA